MLLQRSKKKTYTEDYFHFKYLLFWVQKVVMCAVFADNRFDLKNWLLSVNRSKFKETLKN